MLRRVGATLCRPFSFRARAGRLEYWLTRVAYWTGLFVFFFVLGTASERWGRNAGATHRLTAVLCGYALIGLVPVWAVTVRRLNDLGWRRVWCVATLVPGGGAVPVLIFGMRRGRPANEAGIGPDLDWLQDVFASASL